MKPTAAMLKEIASRANHRALNTANGGKRFLDEDKKELIEAVNASKYTHMTVAKLLATKAEDHVIWVGRLRHWSMGYNHGLFSLSTCKKETPAPAPVQLTVELPRLKTEVLFTDKISQAIEQELMSGSKITEVFSAISGIYKHYKARQIDAAREQVDRMLKEKGLTLEDIAV